MSSNTDGLDAAFAQKLQQLVDASGGKVQLGNGFRSPEQQQTLWDNAVKKYGSEQAARKWVAKPGSSNHEKGMAGDLKGDLELAARLAPQFGLHFPMPWEPWHIEPIGLKSNPNAYTTPRSGNADLDGVMEAFTSVIGGIGAQDSAVGETASSVGEHVSTVGKDSLIGAPVADDAVSSTGVPGLTSMPTGGGDIDKFMAAISGQESGGDYNVVNKDSGASGRFQIMPANWGPWSREAGLGANAPRTPENQDLVARFKMQQYYDQFGSWEKVAKAWYSGPGNVDKNVGGGKGYPDSDTYARQITQRMAS